MKLSIKITGQKALLRKFKEFGNEGEKMVESITKITANDIEAEAKRLAPVDVGTLRQNIAAQKIDDLNYIITSFMPYSPFMEFGTGGFVDVPEELKDIAAQFKGKGKRKVNIHPQPFMYPAFVKARGNYDKDLQQGLDILINRFNNDQSAA